MVKMVTLAVPDFDLQMSLGNCPFRSVRTGNGYNGHRTVMETVTEPNVLRERVLKRICLSSEPFVQAALLRE